jgi:hypothetical protein
MQFEKNVLARIENSFIFNAQFKLPAREHKLIIYLISKLNPQEQDEFFEQTVAITELVSLFQRGEEYKSFYEQINSIIDNMLECKIKFPTKFEIDGNRIPRAINWFQMCEPVTGPDGLMHLKFTFSNVMKPFLLELKEYVRLNPYDLFPMRSNYAIRMYEIFKAESDRLKWKKNVVTMRFTLEELRGVLGLRDEYRDQKFAAFRRRILDVIRDEINANSPSLQVDFVLLKEKNKVSGVEFKITQANTLKTLPDTDLEKKPKKQNTNEKYKPSVAELDLLSKAQMQAFNVLVAFGIYPGITYRQILPTIKGSETEGFEDVFIESAIVYFEKNTTQTNLPELRAATFVKWWHDKKVFDISGETWAVILEEVVAFKKTLQQKNMEAYDNRVKARDMTKHEFETWYKNQGKSNESKK